MPGELRCAFSERAKQDLEEIGDFIAQDNPHRAISFIAELRIRCQQIADFPEAAPLRPELGEGVRLAPYRNYLLFYSLRSEALVIERIVHGARYLPDLF